MNRRGVSTVVSTILLVAITVIIAATLTSATLDMRDELIEPPEQRVFGDTEVVVGAEHRSWNGWNGAGNATRGDIDTVHITYKGGPQFEGSEIGTIEVSWGEGSLRFINPNRFSAETEQDWHDGEPVGAFCTGDFSVGETMTIRMVHNRFQDGGQTDSETVGGIRYVESNSNDISTGGGPFFRVDGRYPVKYAGTGIIQPGDRVTVTFYGPNGNFPVAQTTGQATVATGTPTEYPVPSC
jgi:flagellin-like protein